jgi:hypothetical protein
MASKKKDAPILETDAKDVTEHVPETEEQMIARIKARNGSDDEYVDTYHKEFPY